MMHIGPRIKELRTARKMTQAEFAQRLGVTKSAVSSYENGSRLPSYDILIKITRIFKVSADHLLGCDPKSTIDVTGLSPEQLNTIRDIVVTYQKYNMLYQQMANKDGMGETLATLESMEENSANPPK